MRARSSLVMCRVAVVRRDGQRPASPSSSTVSYERDDFAVTVQYGGPTFCDNTMTSCSGDGCPGRQHQHVGSMSHDLTRPPSDDKLTTSTSTIARCPQHVSGPPCFQDGGQCPLDAASYHCRRCSAALRAISQSVCCSRRAPYPGDVTSGSDVTSANSCVSRVTAETERALDCSESQDTSDSGQNQEQPPESDQQPVKSR